MKNSALEKLLSDFYTVSGMEISVLDADFHTVAMTKSKTPNFCVFIHRADGASAACKASDISRLCEVKESGEPVIYTCPFGITEAILPIVRGEEIIGYIISTMGINTDSMRDSDITDSASPYSKRLSKTKLAAAVGSMKHLDRDELDSHMTVLKLFAEHIANDETLLFAKESIGKLAKRYIKNNLAEKLTLGDIARDLHCSTVTLTEHFKAEFGITVIEYITKKRIQLSEKLLITTDLPLREVSVLSGFADVEYFSRTFKKQNGIAPAAWRRQEKTKDE